MMSRRYLKHNKMMDILSKLTYLFKLKSINSCFFTKMHSSYVKKR